MHLFEYSNNDIINHIFDGLSYEHLSGIAFYYYKQPVVTSVKPTRLVVDSDTGIVLTSTDLIF